MPRRMHAPLRARASVVVQDLPGPPKSRLGPLSRGPNALRALFPRPLDGHVREAAPEVDASDAAAGVPDSLERAQVRQDEPLEAREGVGEERRHAVMLDDEPGRAARRNGGGG